MKFDNILVPIDFSHFSEKALDVAMKLADCCKGKVHLLHVEEDIFHMKRIHKMHPPLEKVCDQVHTAFIAEKRKNLDAIAKTVPKKLLAKALIKEGHAFAEIVKYARAKCIDLIVLASRGESNIKHALLGSTAEKVSRKADCAVLIIKDKRCKFIAP
ncbi:MAG: universal stress protein [Pseudomonadota bacterium]